MKLLYVGFDAWDGQRVISKGLLNDWPLVCINRPEIALSAPSWTTMYTGLPRDEHRVQSVWGLLASDCPFARVPPCTWDYLGAAGWRCGVIGMPATWPARPIACPARDGADGGGWMVSGPFGLKKDERMVWPKGLALLPDYQLSYVAAMPEGKQLYDKWKEMHSPKRAWEIMERIAWCRLRQTALLVEWSANEAGEPLDALFIGFSFPDFWGHKSRDDGDETIGRHDRVDALCVRLLNAMDSYWGAETTVVVSDHGMSVDHTMHGILAVKTRGAGQSPSYRERVRGAEINGLVLSALGLPAESIAAQRGGAEAPPEAGEGRADQALLGDEAALLKDRLKGFGYI